MLLQPLEFSLNRYLALDPETLARLAKLNGKCIRLEITDWQIHFFILPNAHGLELLPNYSGQPDAVISAKLFDLIKIACAKGETSKLFNYPVEISGDISVGEALQKILNQIDIDWEEHLSKITGDIAAHRIGETTRGFQDFLSNTAERLRTHVKSFLQIESDHLPTREEVQRFCDAVTKLQQDVERLEAKNFPPLKKEGQGGFNY